MHLKTIAVEIHLEKDYEILNLWKSYALCHLEFYLGTYLGIVLFSTENLDSMLEITYNVFNSEHINQSIILTKQIDRAEAVTQALLAIRQ